MTFDKAYKKITNIFLSVLMIIGLFTVRTSVDSSKYEVKAEGTSATLLKNYDLKTALFSLCTDGLQAIQAFVHSNTPPSTGVTTKDISLAQDGSVVAWLSGTAILWYSSSDTVFTDQDMNCMFTSFHNITYIDLTGLNFARIRVGRVVSRSGMHDSVR